MSLVPLLGEVIANLPGFIKAGMDVSDLVNKSRALAAQTTPVSQTQLDEVHAVMKTLTAELESGA